MENENLTNYPWKTDKNGHRFRRVGNVVEYEGELVTTHGMLVENTLLIKKKRPAPVPNIICPFNGSQCNNMCARYETDGCGIAKGATPNAGKRCPLPLAIICGEQCALWKLCNKKL